MIRRVVTEAGLQVHAGSNPTQPSGAAAGPKPWADSTAEPAHSVGWA